MATTPIVSEIVTRLDTGDSDPATSEPSYIGTTFDKVIDTSSGYSLSQFFMNYQSFLDSANFVYAGDTEPANHHIALWLDTAHTNQDSIA